jgi:hypothetical protein
MNLVRWEILLSGIFTELAELGIGIEKLAVVLN